MVDGGRLLRRGNGSLINTKGGGFLSGPFVRIGSACLIHGEMKYACCML